MFGGSETTDKALQKAVNPRLERSGASSRSGLSAIVQRGIVTLMCKLRYESQRPRIVRALRSVPGVRQVVDQLQSPPKIVPQRPQTGLTGSLEAT